MAWTLADFLVAGGMLGGVGIAWFLATRRTRSRAYLSATAVALAASFLLVWLNGAVGIIGDERNPANLMYIGVVAVAVAGALLARFRPLGMARATAAAALAQVLVATVALAGCMGPEGPKWPWDLLVLTGFFAALWLVSAWLYRRSARAAPGAI